MSAAVVGVLEIAKRRHEGGNCPIPLCIQTGPENNEKMYRLSAKGH